VDRLEAEFDGKLLVVRVNIQTQAGKQLAPAYGFEYTPTFIFFNEQGNEVWRSVGELNESGLRAEMGKR
jgi:thioredoxin-related protein